MKDQNKTKQKPIEELEALRKQVTKPKGMGTKRKQVEEALQFTRFLVDNSADTMVCVDRDARFIDVNDAFCRSSGYSREELLSMTVHDIDPDYSAEIWPEFWKKLKQSGSLTFESCHRSKEGRIFPVEITATFLEYNGKEYHCSFARDITERKQVQEALRQSEENFQALAENANDGILIAIGEEGWHVYANRRAVEITGYPVQELLKTRIRDLAHPDELSKLTERYKKRLTGLEVPKPYETALVNKDGIKVPMEISPSKTTWQNQPAEMVIFRDITERKRAEEVLRESEATIRTLIDSPVDSILLVNPDGIILETNQTFAQLIGRRVDELIGRCIHDFLPPDLAKSRRARVDEIVHFGVPIRFEDERTGMQLDQSAHPIFDAQGKVTKIAIIARDITERKRAEEALRRKSGEQTLLLDNIQTQVWYLTDEETYGAVNKARAKFFGKKNEEMENKKFYDVLSKDEADICMSGYVEVFKKRKQIHTEEWIMNAKGEKRLLSIIKSPKLNENGDVEYIVCSAEDITDRKRTEYEMKKLNKELERRVIERTAQLEVINKDMQKEITERNEAEEALQASETSYRRLFESAMDGILLLDADTGQITNVNPYLIEMVGYSHNEFLGKKLWEVGLFKHIAESQAGFQKLQSEKYIRYENLPLESKEGRHINVEFVSNIYLEDRQKVIQCNIRDITERRRAEEELKKHEERLEELVKERTQKIRELERQRTEIEKLAAAGLMAARIAHEINNPLAGIKNSFLLVKDAIPQDHPYYEYVGRIETEINRVARIVRQMFDIYRPEQEIKKEFSVDKTLYEVVALLEAVWQENNITIEIDSKPITMEMPEGLLRQVLYNILLNAIEASPRGGVVKIMTKVDNEILTLSISDQGVGIPLEVQPRLFEPFFTSKDASRKGLGLGLAVSKDIVEKLGGDIDFESEPGKGTLFRIILPLKSGERR